jgi:hypothetical protein
MLIQQIHIITYNFPNDFGLIIFDDGCPIQLSKDNIGTYKLYKSYNSKNKVETIKLEILSDIGSIIKEVKYSNSIYEKDIFIKIKYFDDGEYYIEYFDDYC